MEQFPEGAENEDLKHKAIADLFSLGVALDVITSSESGSIDLSRPFFAGLSPKEAADFNGQFFSGSGYEVLRRAISNVKGSLGYLEYDRREEAEKMIRKAELYIEAHNSGGEQAPLVALELALEDIEEAGDIVDLNRPSRSKDKKSGLPLSQYEDLKRRTEALKLSLEELKKKRQRKLAEGLIVRGEFYLGYFKS